MSDDELTINPDNPNAGGWAGAGRNTQDACNCGAKPGTNHAPSCSALK